MNYLNDCFHLWHCALGFCKDYLLSCSNCILLKSLKQLYLLIANTVASRDPESVSLSIGQGEGYMLHKHSWGKFKVGFLFNCCRNDQFRSPRFDLQRLTLWILFTGHTSMAYNQWKLKPDRWLIKSTRHSLPAPQRPSTIASRPETQASLGSSQSLVQKVELNASAIQDRLVTGFIMHAEMYFVVSMRIFVLPRPRLKPKG
jgi:hypothetical protein